MIDRFEDETECPIMIGEHDERVWSEADSGDSMLTKNSRFKGEHEYFRQCSGKQPGVLAVL